MTLLAIVNVKTVFLLIAVGLAAGSAIVLALLVWLGPSDPERQRAAPFAVAVVFLTVFVAGAAVIVAFLRSGTESNLHSYAIRHFDLVKNLLIVGALGLVVALAISVVAALALRPSAVRRNLRHGAHALAEGTVKSRLAPALTRLSWFGRIVLAFSEPSVRIQDFTGTADGSEPGAISSALSGFLPEVGAPTRIGSPFGVDPQREIAPIGAKTVEQDLVSALSEAPYGKAAAALLSLFDRLRPRERLSVTGHVHWSELRGLGVSVALSTESGNVVSSEMIWASDYEATPVPPPSPAVAPPSAPLSLALVGAVWVMFEVAKRSGRRDDDLRRLLDTHKWQSYALVRVGLQATLRTPRARRAIYARALDADPKNRTAQVNLAIVELNQAHHSDGSLTKSGLERLNELYAAIPTGRDAPFDPVRGPIAFNLAVEALNACHRQRGTGSRPPAAAVLRVRPQRDRLRDFIIDLEIMLARPSYRGGARDARTRDQLEALEPFALILWAATDQVCRGPMSLSADEQERARRCGASVHTPAALAWHFAENHVRHWHVTLGYVTTHELTARSRYNLACYWAACDDDKRALEELSKSLGPGTIAVRSVRDDPAFQRLRRNPGFARILDEAELGPM